MKLFYILLLGVLVCLTPEFAACQARGVSLAESKTIKVGDAERSYNLFVPGKARGKKSPLVLVFHGGGGNAAQVERGTGFSELAVKEGFIVAYPQGTGNQWNDGRRFPARRGTGSPEADLAFIRAMIDAITKEHKIDEKRIFSTGISNGGFFSHFLGAKMSDRLAAIAPVVGGIGKEIAEDFRPEKPVSVLIIQGTEDPLVPYGGGTVGRNRGEFISTDEAVRKWTDHNRTSSKPKISVPKEVNADDGCHVEISQWNGGKGGSEVHLYKLIGGGHSWPGHGNRLPRVLVGDVCMEIDATAVVWEFFRTHPKK